MLIVGDIVEPWELSSTAVGVVLFDSVKKIPRVVADWPNNDNFTFTDRDGWETGTEFKVVYVPESVEPEIDALTKSAWALKSVWFERDVTNVDPGNIWRRVAQHIEDNFVEKAPKVDYPLTIVDEEGDTWSRVPENIDMYYFIDEDGYDVSHETREGVRTQYGIRKEY